MVEHLRHADSLTSDELALFRRALAAVEGSPDAVPVLRDLVESLLADRMRGLREVNVSLSREVQERRLVELALRESEERLEDLALTTADWMWEVDASGRFTACSGRVRDVLGYAPDEIIGRTPFDLMVEEDAAAIAPLFERLMRERTGCSELKNRNRHKDGREVVLLTSCVPMLNEAGELLGFRGVDKDITLRERMERSLLQQTRELEALLAAGRAIAASIDYDEVLHRVAQAAGEALGTAECVIWEYSPDGEMAVFRCLWQRDPQPGVAESLAESSYAVRSHAGGLDALRAGVVVQQSRSDPDLPAYDAEDMDKWGEKTWLTVPLVLDGELLGIMILIESERERRFDPDEVRMAGVIGEQAAVALHNALRHRREERQNRWLRSLVRAARVISESQDPDAALGEVARLAADAMQSPAAFVYEFGVRPRRARHAGELGLRIRRERRPRRHGLGGLRGAGGPPRAAGGAVRRDAVRPGAPPEREGAHGALGRADPAQRPAALARGRHRHDRRGRGPGRAHVRRGGTGLHARVRRPGDPGTEHRALGDHRRPHGARQPPRVLRAARAGARPRAALRDDRLAADDRHRRLQGAQRHLRAPGR